MFCSNYNNYYLSTFDVDAPDDDGGVLPDDGGIGRVGVSIAPAPAATGGVPFVVGR